MPVTDYNQGMIYKLAQRDGRGEIYIGSTTNIIQIRARHKTRCCDPKYTDYVYQHIRYNGGWDNWCCVAIEIFPCQSKTELKIRERNWIENNNPALNTAAPYGFRTGK